MLTKERRKEIIKILNKNEEPLKGTELANKFCVSRQVIVQDIAVIRAQGYNILATSIGYIMPTLSTKNKNIKTIVCKHEGYENMEEELKIMVDRGAKVIDVIIEHSVYGEIRCPLMISSRMDLEDFIEKIRNNKGEPLSSLTGGAHIHTLEVPNNRAYNKIIELLGEQGYLIKGE